jgi:hypothetical protein
VRMDELELVCQEAARNLVARMPRPLQPSVVLPLPEATRVLTLPDWPDDDPSRFDLLARFAQDVMRPANAPCFGFVAEAVAAADGDQAVDVVVVAYGARRTEARVTAAPFADDSIGEFTASESLDTQAMPFLAPLQHAVDAAVPPDAFGVTAT